MTDKLPALHQQNSEGSTSEGVSSGEFATSVGKSLSWKLQPRQPLMIPSNIANPLNLKDRLNIGKAEIVDRPYLAEKKNFGFEQFERETGIYQGKLINDLAQSVKKPEEVSREVWFANQFIKIYHEVNLVSSFMLNGACTDETCSKMRAATHNYLWEDDPAVSKGKALSAPAYIRLVLDNAQATMADSRVFPNQSGMNFPECFSEVISPMFRRFFRVYCHFYRHHLSQMEDLKIELRVRYCFAHCCFFVREFGLVPSVEYDTIKPILDQWLSECTLLQGADENKAEEKKA